jgi:hypothetical protein
MRFLIILLVSVSMLLACKKKEQPKPPEAVQLLFPEKNSECTTGVVLNSITSEVEFSWQASANTESYSLVVVNLNGGARQTLNVNTTKVKLAINQGTPYSWSVTSKNMAVQETASSESWNFYNSGFETTYAPFPAEIIAPKMGESVARDINNEVVLRWSGADVDDDIVGYDVYLSTVSPPSEPNFTLGSSNSSQKVTVTADTVYYWKVVTKDREGNTSDSGIFQFRAL